MSFEDKIIVWSAFGDEKEEKWAEEGISKHYILCRNRLDWVHTNVDVDFVLNSEEILNDQLHPSLSTPKENENERFGFLQLQLQLQRTWSNISFVWPAERQKRTRDSVRCVAGKPTVTTAQPRFNISRLTALKNKFDFEEKIESIETEKKFLRDFCRHKNHHGNNRGIIITINNKTHIDQLSTKITNVIR